VGVVAIHFGAVAVMNGFLGQAWLGEDIIYETNIMEDREKAIAAARKCVLSKMRGLLADA